MKRLLFILAAFLVMGFVANASDFMTFENKAFSIGYPSDWEITYDSDDCLNLENADGDIWFDITFNERGPKKEELQDAVDNWVWLKENHGYKIDQKLVKDDYALVRSIDTDPDDGTVTVVVWYVMISSEPQGFSGTMNSTFEQANEALNLLVEMLATLEPK